MNYVWELGALCSIYVIAALSLNMLQGSLGIMTIAQAAFMCVGAYSTAILTSRGLTGFLLSVLVGAALSCALAMLLAWPALTLTGFVYTIVSFAAMLVVTALSTALNSLTGGSYGIPGIPQLAIGGLQLGSTEQYAITYAVLAAVAVAGCIWLAHSHWGLTMRAVRESSAAARSLGKPVTGLTLAVYAGSGALASLSGSLYAAFTGYLDPTVFTVSTSFLLVSMVVIGGSGNVWAVAAGALLMSLLPNLLPLVAPQTAATVGPATQVLYGVIIVVLLVFRPGGLFPERSLKFSPATRDSADELAVPAELARKEPVRSGGADALRITGLSKRFGGLQANDAVSFVVSSGVITGLLGGNGAGKSTLLGMIAGFIKRDSGTVQHDGSSLPRSPVAIARSGVVRTFQELRLFERMTIQENVLIGDPAVGRSFRSWGTLRRAACNAESLIRELGLDPTSRARVASIAYGDRKLIAVARALASGATVLMLDEPFSGLTDSEIERMSSLLRRLAASGVAVLLIDHNAQAVVDLSDYIVVLDHGKVIASGRPADVVNDQAVIEAYFGKDPISVGEEVAQR